LAADHNEYDNNHDWTTTDAALAADHNEYDNNHISRDAELAADHTQRVSPNDQRSFVFAS